MIRSWLFFVLFGASLALKCTLSKGQYYTMDSIVPCIEGIPFSQAIRNNTLDGVRKTMNLYAFSDISLDSPKSQLMHVSVDIRERLDAISAKNYTKDHEFQQDLAGLFTSLHDAHTLYMKPDSCYDFYYLQPFALAARLNANNKLEVFVDGLYKFWSQSVYSGLYLNLYEGMTVSRINNVDAIEEITNFAAANGFVSKDLSASFNRILWNGYSERNALFRPIPANSSVTWTFSDGSSTGTSVTIPWVVSSLETINLATCYGNQTKAPKRSAFDAFHKARFELDEPKEKRDLDLCNVFSLSSSIDVRTADSKTLVIQISDFEDSSSKFFTTLRDAFTCATDNNLNRLILDLRGNGGGFVCVGLELIRLLTGEDAKVIYDMRRSPLMDKMIPKDFMDFSDSTWADPETGQLYHNSDWYFPGVQHTRGGVTSGYSKQVKYVCSTTSLLPHKFDKILVLSDGLCGSTCALVSTFLRESNATVRTLSIGGLPDQEKMAFMSFPGGFVFDETKLQTWLKKLNMQNEPTAPKPFNTSCSLSFTISEVYGNEKGERETPLEFVFKPADFRLKTWGRFTGLPDALYDQVTPFFDKFGNSKLVIIVAGTIVGLVVLICCLVGVVYVVMRRRSPKRGYKKVPAHPSGH